MNRSAKGGARSSLHYEGEGVLIHPPHQGWHGTEERCVTSGGLAGSPGGTGVSRPISESEVASDVLAVDGLSDVNYFSRSTTITFPYRAGALTHHFCNPRGVVAS
jgi:hypothetical protein